MFHFRTGARTEIQHAALKNQKQHFQCLPGTGCLRSRSFSVGLCVSETADQQRCQITEGVSYFWSSVLCVCRGAVALHCIPIVLLNAHWQEIPKVYGNSKFQNSFHKIVIFFCLFLCFKETRHHNLPHTTLAVCLASVVSVTRFPPMYHNRAHHLMQFIYLFMYFCSATCLGMPALYVYGRGWSICQVIHGWSHVLRAHWEFYILYLCPLPPTKKKEIEFFYNS